MVTAGETGFRAAGSAVTIKEDYVNSGMSHSAAARSQGPSIVARDLWGSITETPARLLTAEERAQLAVISSVVRFAKGTTIYHEGDHAGAVFNLISGVVKSYKTQPDGSRHIAGFLFPDDLDRTGRRRAICELG
jgi:hypothetical protein